MLAVFLFLVFRSIGLHPSIFSDEWTYSVGSRLSRLASASTPLYIYFFVYRITKHCGSQFLECARVLNAFFFVAAAPFIYLVARKLTTRWIAVLVTILSILAPINTYTAYFMPEAMYFFGFWLLTWFVLTFGKLRPQYYGSLIGSLLGLLFLIKINAIFLLPGITAFIAYNSFRAISSRRLRVFVVTFGCMVLATLIVRVGIGYLCARTAGLDILGSRYGSLAESSLGSARFSQMTGEIFGILRGHIMALAVLFGVPLASIATLVFERHRDGEGEDRLQAVGFYALALTIVLLITVAYFAASILGEGPYESLARLHMRYYNFLFPLFLIIVAGQISSKGRRRNLYVLIPSVLAIFALILYASTSLLRLYSPNLIDGPELHGITTGKTLFYIVIVLGIVCLLAWAFNQRRGSQLFLFVFVPITVLCSTTNANSELRQHLAADVYDKAGSFAHDELDRAERSKLVVVGSELASLYRVLFYVDDPKATLMAIPSGTPLDLSAIPRNREWVLLLGDHRVPNAIQNQISGDGYTLFRLPLNSPDDGSGSMAETIDFTHPFRFGVVKRISGLSVSQLFGRWSDSREVQIEMFSPLPRRFDLHLIAKAFGPNTQLPFSIRIGDEAQTFRLSSSPSDVSIPFNTSGDEKLITIEVPQPTSPKQLGLGSDSRPLGIALTQMTIVARGKVPAGN